jgi:hypothetical protein
MFGPKWTYSYEGRARQENGRGVNGLLMVLGLSGWFGRILVAPQKECEWGLEFRANCIDGERYNFMSSGAAGAEKSNDVAKDRDPC